MCVTRRGVSALVGLGCATSRSLLPTSGRGLSCVGEVWLLEASLLPRCDPALSWTSIIHRMHLRIRASFARLCGYFRHSYCVYAQKLAPRRSFDEGLPVAAYNGHAQRREPVWIVVPHNSCGGEHRVVWGDVRSVAGGLLDGFDFLFAAGVVEGADDNGLAEEDIARGGELGLELLV